MKKSTALKKTYWFFSGTVSMVVKVIATILLIAVVTSAICATVFALYIDQYIKPYIDNIDIEDIQLNLTSFVYATDPETGEEIELEQLHDEENRIWVEYEQIPDHLINALIAVEDSRFRTHKGVDWIRTIGATINMVVPIPGFAGGGSTITQQVIKNITGEDDVTAQRKIQEILRALEFERNTTKNDILELYLNIVYFGHGCNGIEVAAQTYFGKTVSELSLAESAAIVGITKSPTYYNPLRHPDHNKERQELILLLMKNQGLIDEKTYEAAKAEKLVFNEAASDLTNQPMQSYYVDQVINDVIAALVEEKGYSETYAKNLLFSGGLKIYCNIDLDVQEVLDSVYQDPDQFPIITGDKQPESAMVIMDPYNGQVKAMVGGRGEKTTNRAWNRATMTKRQPGSSIKPLTVYAPGIEYGFITPASVFDDSPLNEETRWPKNQSSGFSGRMTVKKAVQLSTNTVATKVLDLVTPERSFSFATVNLGLDLVRSKTISEQVFSDIDYAPLALGGLTDGLSVLEMTAAYASFVNKGVYTEPSTFSLVLDSENNVILDNTPDTHVAMKEKTAYYMNYLLQSVVTSGTGTKAQLENMAVAGKTGTTNDDKDRWFVGYTPYYVAAVWLGYDTPKEIKLDKSYNPSLYVWKAVMEQLHEGLEPKTFFEMETVNAQYCLDSGLAPSPYCELDPRGNRITSGTFLKEDVPTQTCDCHVPVTIDTTTNMRSTVYCPSENVKTIALINVARTGEIPMSDDAYLFKNAVYAADGSAPATDASGEARDYNTYCTQHTSFEELVPDEWVPPSVDIPDTTPEDGSVTEPDNGTTDVPNNDDTTDTTDQENNSGGIGSGIVDWFNNLINR